MLQGACNNGTAKLMAQSSLRRAKDLAKAESDRGQDTNTWTLFGVGCTAAIVSVVPKKGDHRCHVAVSSPQGIDTILEYFHFGC